MRRTIITPLLAGMPLVVMVGCAGVPNASTTNGPTPATASMAPSAPAPDGANWSDNWCAPIGPASFKVDAATEAGSLDVLVVDAQGVAQAGVTVTVIHPPPQNAGCLDAVVTAQTGADGHAKFQELRTGHYYAAFDSRGTGKVPVEVTSGATATVTLTR